MNGWGIRDAAERVLESITAIQNVFISSTAIEWTDIVHSVEDRRIWVDRHQRSGYPVVVVVASGDVVGSWLFGDFRDSTKWPGYRLTVENTIHVRVLGTGERVSVANS